MIPELGQFALILALCTAIVLAFVPLVGTFTGHSGWMAMAKPAAGAQAFFVSLSYACLTWSFITHDFSVLYVANTSNSGLPFVYLISGVWGGHEGSILFWCFISALWTVAVAAFSRSLPQVLLARVLSVLGFVSVGFLLFVLLTSNPFERLFPVPLDGASLNPLLQDPGMAIHPPMLYLGYVGFSVAFAFAVAALIGGQLDSATLRWMRPWTNIAWMFLTIGISLGSWWAYYELGWGGWWFWDPVENASFMPWLVGTALIHSLAASEKRGVFKAWTVLLAVLAFSLSLLGTFLVRSGVLTSVHSFATDPTRGLYILLFLGVVVGGSLLLFAVRAHKLTSTATFELVSRESALLLNNILLVVASAAVLLGTLYPLFVDALGFGKMSVGEQYFNAVFVPLMLPILLVVGLGALLNWKRDKLSGRAVPLAMLGIASVVLAAVLATQLRIISIPRRFSGPMKEIWQMQPRLERLRGGRALKLMEDRRFRAAYDFMLLRSSIDERLVASVEWWTKVQTLSDEERVEAAANRPTIDSIWPDRRNKGKRKPASTVAESEDGAVSKPAPKRRRRTRRKPANGSTGSSTPKS